MRSCCGWGREAFPPWELCRCPKWCKARMAILAKGAVRYCARTAFQQKWRHLLLIWLASEDEREGEEGWRRCRRRAFQVHVCWACAPMRWL